MDQSIDDFEQYVKHKDTTPAGLKGSPKKTKRRAKDTISSPIRAHLYRSAEGAQASPRHGQKKSAQDYSMYLASPARAPTSLAKIPRSPAEAPGSPSKAPSSPLQDRCSTLRDPASPSKAPSSPVKKWWDYPAAAGKKGKASSSRFTIQLKRTQVKFAAARPTQEIVVAQETKEARLARLQFAKNLKNAPITKGQKLAAIRVEGMRKAALLKAE